MSSDAHSSGDNGWGSLEGIPTGWYDVIRHPRRIHLLDILDDSHTPLSLTALTTAVVETEGGDVSNEQARHDVRVSLVHTHLPRLADAGVIEWDTETGVKFVDEPPIDPTALSTLLALCDCERCDRLLESLAHPVRMRVVSLVDDHDRPVSIDTLASKLAARNVDSLSDPERAMLSLHHTHLPMLADAGIIEFDYESGLVRQHERALSVIE